MADPHLWFTKASIEIVSKMISSVNSIRLWC
jgi:hypothetical protein